MDFWKTTTILLIFLIAFLSVVVYMEDKNTIDIQGLKISIEDFGILNDATPVGPYALCSIPQNKCVKMLKQDFN